MLKALFRGQTVTRALMNERCSTVSLEGLHVLDLGSGATKGSYHKYFFRPAAQVYTADKKQGVAMHAQLDFEVDALPFDTDQFDAVLSFNLFEHIFNIRHVLKETERVTKSGGQLIGFVPFLINYHPDPHDYFRYTKEALIKLFEEAGYGEVSIEEIGGGPFLVHANNIVLSFPRVMRPVLVLPCMFLDWIFLSMSTNARERFPLGYFFVARKV